MHEVVGDLWTWPAQYRVITTNGVVSYDRLIMGAGVALEAKRRFPHIPVILGRYVQEYGNRCFILKGEGLITYPTKVHYKQLSNVLLIQRSAKELVEIADKYELRSIVMPRPGCGCGGLSWTQVRPWLTDIFDHRFTICTPE